MKKAFFLIFFILYPLNLFADDPSPAYADVPLVKGLAIVKIKSRRVDMEYEQAVEITEESAVFVGLDDFGGEMFKLFFNPGGMMILAQGRLMQTKGDKLKKILSLPLTQQEFLSVVKFERPDGFYESVAEQGVLWKKNRKKGLQILFDGFVKQNKKKFPMHFRIQYKKNFFDLEWVKVNLR